MENKVQQMIRFLMILAVLTCSKMQAQTPGYLGRKNLVSANLGMGLTIVSYGPSMNYGLAYERALSRGFSVELGYCAGYGKVNMENIYERNSDYGNAVVKYKGKDGSLYANGGTLKYKFSSPGIKVKFYFPNKGGSAPFGFFFGLEFRNFKTSNIDITNCIFDFREYGTWNSTKISGSEFKPVNSTHQMKLFGLSVGVNRFLTDRISLGFYVNSGVLFNYGLDGINGEYQVDKMALSSVVWHVRSKAFFRPTLNFGFAF